MNRLKYLICAKTQYDIQSPFMFDLYQNVIAPKLDKTTLERCGIASKDLFGQLCYKLTDHYKAIESDNILVGCDKTLSLPDGSKVGVVRNPHRSKTSEEAWDRLFKEPFVTLSVDLFDIGLVFTSPKLSKQHIVFRVF